ncbi:MAG TPA: hypothetical protein VIJ06_05905 [Methylovirgula sp.]
MEDDQKVNALEQPYAPGREPIPLRWDAEHVGCRLVRAFETLDRLPRVRGPREPGGHWPKHAVEWADQLARADLDESEKRTRDIAQNRSILRPSAAEIAEMETAFDWLRELRAADSGMALVASLWALCSARHRSLRKLCAQKQWAPYTFYRKRAKALAYLADWLNARHVPVF